MNKRYKKNINCFTRSVKEAIDLLGMHSYHVNIEPKESERYKATASWHGLLKFPLEDPRQFTIEYSPSWLQSKNTTRHDIRTTAWHEVLECMLARLTEFSNNRYELINPRETQSEIHAVIRTFENRLCPIIFKHLDKAS